MRYVVFPGLDKEVGLPRVVKFGGAVVEGLSLDEVAELLKRLTCSA